MADGRAHGGEEEAEERDGEETVAKDEPRFTPLVSADEVGNLDVEACAGGGVKSAEKPNSGADDADGGAGARAEATHHGGIDVFHDDGGEHRQHGGNAEGKGKSELACAGQFTVVSYVRQEAVFGF